MRHAQFRGREGLVLMAGILVALAVTALAHAALLLAGAEAVVTRTEGRRIEVARNAAAALAVLEAALDSLPWTGSPELPTGRVRALRLSPEVALLMADGIGLRTPERRGRVLWAPHPASRLRARSGWIQSPTPVQVTPGGDMGVYDGTPCASGPVPLPRPGWAAPAGWDTRPRLGPVPLDDLVSRLPSLVPGEISLDSTVFAAVSGSAVVSGHAAGVMVVQGSLVLAGGAVLEGWVFVAGDMRVAGGARFRGLADVGGALTVEAAGTLIPDPCAGVGALAVNRAWSRPWGVGPLAWPAF